MTKVRAPLSIDEAMARIAGKVPGGWKALAKHLDYHVRTVRKWGDEDCDDEISLKAAIELDILFQHHGGVGRPLYDVHGRLVGAAAATAFADQFDVIRRLADFAKETGDANQALLRYALPEASETDRLSAQRELLDALQIIEQLLLGLAAEVPQNSRAPP